MFAHMLMNSGSILLSDFLLVSNFKVTLYLSFLLYISITNRFSVSIVHLPLPKVYSRSFLKVWTKGHYNQPDVK